MAASLQEAHQAIENALHRDESFGRAALQFLAGDIVIQQRREQDLHPFLPPELVGFSAHRVALPTLKIYCLSDKIAPHMNGNEKVVLPLAGDARGLHIAKSARFFFFTGRKKKPAAEKSVLKRPSATAI